MNQTLCGDHNEYPNAQKMRKWGQVALLPNVGWEGCFTYSWTEWKGERFQNFDLVNKNIFMYAHIFKIDCTVCKKVLEPYSLTRHRRLQLGLSQRGCILNSNRTGLGWQRQAASCYQEAYDDSNYQNVWEPLSLSLLTINFNGKMK